MMANFQFFEAYAIVDLFCIALTLIAAANVHRDSGSETQVRYFNLLLTTYLAFVATDLAWAFMMFSGLVPNNLAAIATLSGVNKIAVAFTGYFWFCYSLARFESPLVYNRTLRLVSALPVALVPAIYIAGFVLDLNIVFLGEGRQANGPTSLAISGIALFYLAAATVAALRNYRRTETKAQRRTCLVYIAFMVFPAAGAIFDAFVPNTPVMAPSMMVSVFLVLLSLQESRISSDELTGLNNRRRADVYLEESLSHASAESPLYLFIIDMDRFKSINDTYGHLEGDRALQLMATALRQACATFDSFAARWGGDEFVMICTHDIGDDPARVAGVIKARLADQVRESGVAYGLACSVGYARCDSPEQTADNLVAEADRMLYDAKR